MLIATLSNKKAFAFSALKNHTKQARSFHVQERFILQPEAMSQATSGLTVRWDVAERLNHKT
jgi:hypothetical protein